MGQVPIRGEYTNYCLHLTVFYREFQSSDHRKGGKRASKSEFGVPQREQGGPQGLRSVILRKGRELRGSQKQLERP